MLRQSSLRLLFALSLAFSPACSKSSEGTSVDSVLQSAAALTEANENGAITWDVAPSGNIKAALRSADGKVLTTGVTGQVTWKGASGETSVPLVAHPTTGVLSAAGPKLDGDITPLSYVLLVQGKPWTGTLHLPAGGTKQLADSAKASVTKPLASKTGPNGGATQLVGDDVVEVVADKDSGELRVYVLDPGLKVVPVGERKVKIAVVVGDGSEIVDLTPDPSGLHFAGKLSLKANPVKLTVSVQTKGSTQVALFGWTPGVQVVVGGPRAANVNIWITTGWAGRAHGHDDDEHHDNGNNGKGKKLGHKKH